MKIYTIEELVAFGDLNKLLEEGEVFDVIWCDREELCLFSEATDADESDEI